MNEPRALAPFVAGTRFRESMRLATVLSFATRPDLPRHEPGTVSS
jgi:hypothetical protein